MLDPHQALRTASVPLWLKFPVEPSAERAERYLHTTHPFDEIRLTLFSHGTNGVGVAGIERWRSIVGRARGHGELIAVDPESFPRDLATPARFNQELRRVDGRPTPPRPLTLDELDAFIDEAGPYPGVEWPGP
jgi:hypothetical protein